jgi:rRNA maturation protein Nop10
MGQVRGDFLELRLKCPRCGLDLSNLVPERCEDCPTVRHWRQRAEAASVQLQKYRLDLQCRNAAQSGD